MDASPEAFAYRCLPLAMANAHGWEIANAAGFTARWTAGGSVEDVEIRLDDPAAPGNPVSLFGQATLTFHIEGLFRTPPGWNLWIGGPPNAAKDGVAPLSGLIETDWSPYSFTMNWRFTRPDVWVRFEPGETICFFFPVERGIVETTAPRLRGIDEAPDLKRQFEAWSASRDAFHLRMREAPPANPGDKWQKLYYRGVDADGVPAATGHQTKLRVPAFTAEPPARMVSVPSPAACPAGAYPPPEATDGSRLARRDWMMGVQTQLRALSPLSGRLNRYEGVTADFFLHNHYAANVPALLGGEMATWPALRRWTPDYIARLVGDRLIEFQGDRDGDARFEFEKDDHRRTMPFDRFIAMIGAAGAGNASYVTAYNSAANRTALAPLHAELGRVDALLVPGADGLDAMMWIGPARTFTPLHFDLTNNLVAQIVGRKRVILVPPSEASKLDASGEVVSAVGDLLDPQTLVRTPALRDLTLFDLVLEPGDMLFVPIGWWHQVTALDFSVTVTYTNFRWRNAWHETFPREPRSTEAGHFAAPDVQ